MLPGAWTFRTLGLATEWNLKPLLRRRKNSINTLSKNGFFTHRPPGRRKMKTPFDIKLYM